MRAIIRKSAARGEVVAPPSKSMAHRLLICAGLAEGDSVIKGVEASDDVLATIACLGALGIECEYENGTVTVHGKGRIQPARVLNCNECGSTLRFFVPICLLSDSEATLTGSERLMQRPLDIYRAMCEEKGLFYSLEGTYLKVKGRIQSGTYSLPANISSQFISGLLFVLPLLEGNSTICLKGKIESKPYIDMTLFALNQFGVSVYWKNESTLYIKGSQSYKCKELFVEGDYSNAAFFEAFNYLGGAVAVKGLDRHSLQGDKIYRMYFPFLSACRPTLDVADCPDLAPILFALAACKNGGVFTGTARLKLKESDRGAAMAEELAKCGVGVTIEADRITVENGVHAPDEPIQGHGDHRIVMALTVLLSTVGGEIIGAEAVNKSLPSFFEIIKQLGVEFDVYE